LIEPVEGQLAGEGCDAQRESAIMIDYGHFQLTLQNLSAQFRNYQTLATETPTLIKEAVAESVIQRFEICYDCLWKILKRYLGGELGLPDLPNSPRPILRLAFENNLLTPPLALWMDYAEARTNTTHIYSGEKAQAALDLIEPFIKGATQLYQDLTSRVLDD
jgi:nucleotidyltransferase substrate binding protein (TIGR01987 family)